MYDEAQRENQSDLGWLRTWWEDEFRQPSVGNPLFENLTEAELTQMHLRRLFAKGGKAALIDGKIHLGQSEARTLGKFTGDWVSDTWERRMAMGLEPFEK